MQKQRVKASIARIKKYLSSIDFPPNTRDCSLEMEEIESYIEEIEKTAITTKRELGVKALEAVKKAFLEEMI